MSRLMSVSLTEDAVRTRTKTVTRRKGWWVDRNGRRILREGDRLTLCRKVMGRKRADGTVEHLVRLAEVEVVSVSREPVNAITADEIVREGVDPAVIDRAWVAAGGTIEDTGQPSPPPSTWAWVSWFCGEMECAPYDLITRIEWRYLDECPTCRGQFGDRMPGWEFGSDWDWVPCPDVWHRDTRRLTTEERESPMVST